MPNAIGVASGAYCASTYHKFSPEMPIKAYMASGSGIALASTCAYLDQQSALGLIGCSVSVVLMGAPLATLSTVIKDKSTASIPFGTSLACWLNALSWSAYGFLVADNIMVCRT